MSLLGDLLSRFDAMKRRGAGLLANPSELFSETGFGPEFGGAPSLSYRTREQMGLLGSVFPEVQQMGRDEFKRDQGLLNQAMTDVALAAPVTVYHGSPHLFDKFDMSKIGTGEGAQAYGHGLYFAESPGVAKSYQESLARPVTLKGKPALRDIGGVASDDDLIEQILTSTNNPQSARKYLVDAAASFPERNFGRLLARFDELQASGHIAGGGHLYKAELSPDPEDFLQWDKPLSEQPQAVRDVVKRSGLLNHDGTLGTIEGAKRNPTGDDLIRALRDMWNENLGPDGVTGLTAQHGSDAASQYLRSLGIPGIRYLDQGSRGGRPQFRGDSAHLAAAGSFKSSGYAPEQALAGMRQAYKNAKPGELEAAINEAYDIAPPSTYNYVLFDDALAKILERNGQPMGLLGP